ncbi:MAG: hypothetical protein RI885_2655 [Actinomycetota bacterium]
MISLREALDGHRNSLGLVRLIMAMAVIFDHAFPLGGWGTAPFLGMTRGQQSLGGLAVLGFLAISGFLVTKSALGSDVLQFLWRRFLRIFPGFWLALLVGAFVVGPALWLAEGRPLGSYLSIGPGSPIAYLYSNATLTIGQYGISDLLVETTPYGDAGNGGPINGSIWTLTYEWVCYLLLAGLLAVGVLGKAKLVVPLTAAFFFLMQLVNQIQPGGAAAVFPFFGDVWRLNFGFIFFVGASLALYSHKIPFDHRLGIAAGVLSLVLLRTGGFNTVGYVLFAYTVLYVAAALPRQTQWIGAKNDYSYGVYLYGWVVQQVLAYLGVNQLGYLPYVMLSLAGAFVLAVGSWHLVEKRALKLKDWGPGRGLRSFSEAGRTRRAERQAVAVDPTHR